MQEKVRFLLNSKAHLKMLHKTKHTEHTGPAANMLILTILKDQMAIKCAAKNYDFYLLSKLS